MKTESAKTKIQKYFLSTYIRPNTSTEQPQLVYPDKPLITADKETYNLFTNFYFQCISFFSNPDRCIISF